MQITRHGEALNVLGTQPVVGQLAPAFKVKDLNDREVSLSDLKGKVVFLSIVPDIDTSVCTLQTKRFSEEAAKLPEIEFFTVSVNTREEQANWCQAESANMQMLHDTEKVFGSAYGLVIEGSGLLARSIFVIDQAGKLVYEEIVPEMTHEPNYDQALNVAKSLA